MSIMKLAAPVLLLLNAVFAAQDQPDLVRRRGNDGTTTVGSDEAGRKLNKVPVSSANKGKLDSSLKALVSGDVEKATANGIVTFNRGGESSNNNNQNNSNTSSGSAISVEVVNVDILVPIDVADALNWKLETEVGFKKAAKYGATVSGSIPVENLSQLEAYEEIITVSYPRGKLSTGSVTSQAFQAMSIDTVRELYNLRGEGLTIGVISDSFNCLGGASAGIASGDLPNDVIVSLDYFGSDCIDEGRAMMELIYDIAPDVTLAFHTAIGGQAVFALAVETLGTFCDIIVDDIVYFAEVLNQAGPIAQAITDVEEAGIPYFMSQGNSYHDNLAAWETNTGFVGSGIFFYSGGRGELHDFGFGAQLPIAPFEGGQWVVVLSWDQPALSANGVVGTASDLDLAVVSASGNVIDLDSAINLGGDPIAVVAGQVDFADPPVAVQIIWFEGPQPMNMKLTFVSGVDLDSGFTSGYHPTSLGHHNGPDGAGVAATFYQTTPNFSGAATATARGFTSRGGTPFLFDNDGNRLEEPLIVENPKFTAPDGTSTTFFGENNIFTGTSAAAPHAAALAALLLEADPSLTPHQIYSVMRETAIDMDDVFATGDFDVGYDFVTGAGFIDAEAAVESILGAAPQPTPTPPQPTPTQSPPSDGGGCFSSSVTLVVEDRGPTALQDIKLGDKVMVRHDRFEPVYSFGHYDPSSMGSFVKITAGTSPQQKPLHVSRNHMLSVVGKNMVPALLVEVGDFIMSGEGQAVPVLSKVYDQLDRGMYAPFTPSGTIVVNGIVASCYIAFQESSHIEVGSWSSPLSYHWMAHAYTFPHRFYCQYVSRCESEKYRDDGLSSWVGGGYEVGSWLLEETNVLYLGLTLCVTAPIGIVFSLVDSIPCELSNAVFTLAIAFGLMVTSKFLSRRVK